MEEILLKIEPNFAIPVQKADLIKTIYKQYNVILWILWADV